MYNLVEGERVRLVPATDEDAAVEWGYAESYIVPACLGEYRLENLSGSPCALIAQGQSRLGFSIASAFPANRKRGICMNRKDSADPESVPSPAPSPSRLMPAAPL